MCYDELRCNIIFLTISYVQVSSRTLHVPWSTAGTLCPIGDLFNYASGAPCDESMVDLCTLSDVHTRKDSFSVEMRHEIQFYDGNYDSGRVVQFTDRLTDGGYDSKAKAYRFYARENYKKGDQVLGPCKSSKI